jgi:hypothetical protein
MLRLKHPHRFTSMGTARWHGIIYGEGAVGLPLLEPVIYHGRFGSSLFQSIYARNALSLWTYPSVLEWHVLAAFVLASSIYFWPLAVVGGLMLAASIMTAVRIGMDAALPSGSPRWSRPLVCLLTYVQPLIRGWHRSRHWFCSRTNPAIRAHDLPPARARRQRRGERDLCWESAQAIGRDALLHQIEQECRRRAWPADFDVSMRPWDFELIGDPWHSLRVHTGTEELGWPRRFTRCRIVAVSCPMTRALAAGMAVAAVLSVLSGNQVAMAVVFALSCIVLIVLVRSLKRCMNGAVRLVAHCGQTAGLVPWKPEVPKHEEQP